MLEIRVLPIFHFFMEIEGSRFERLPSQSGLETRFRGEFTNCYDDSEAVWENKMVVFSCGSKISWSWRSKSGCLSEQRYCSKLILEHRGITIWTKSQSSLGIAAGLEVSLWCVPTVLKRWAICQHTKCFSARLIVLASFVWLGSPTSTHTGSSTNLVMFWVGTATNSEENEQIDVPNVLESS